MCRILTWGVRKCSGELAERSLLSGVRMCIGGKYRLRGAMVRVTGQGCSS